MNPNEYPWSIYDRWKTTPPEPFDEAVEDYKAAQKEWEWEVANER